MKRLIALALLAAPASAAAHLGGVPTTAWFTAPRGVGHVVGDALTFAWTDFDDLADTQDTVIDFFFTQQMPPTYRMGAQPPGLEGTAIVKGIVEQDPTNQHVWDVSEVPPGSYFLFSIAYDPPFEMVAFAKGVVTVAREGDPVHPAVIFTEPDGDTDISRASYTMRWEAFDPDGTGKIRIEGTQAGDGTDLQVIAEGLDPAAGAFTWDTTEVARGEWLLRITLEDERGLSHTAWAQFFLRVADPLPGTGGSGGSGGTGGSDGTGGAGDGGAGGAGGSGGDAGGEGGTGGTGGSSGRSTGGGRNDDGDDGGCASASGGASLLGLLAATAWGRRRRLGYGGTKPCAASTGERRSSSTKARASAAQGPGGIAAR